MRRKKTASLERKLAAYSALMAGVVSISTNATGQIIYNDITPDSLCGDSASFSADFNLDGIADLQVFQGFSPTANMVGINIQKGCEVLGSVNGNYFYPFVLNLNDTIDAGRPDWHKNDNGTLNWQNISGSDYGNWQGGITDKYLGVRVQFDGFWHYGWMRLDVAADAKTFVVKDYAMDDRGGMEMLAGKGTSVHNVKNVKATLTARTGNAADIKISFSRAENESMLSEYRVFLVKYYKVDSFTVSRATMLSSARYLKLTKTGADFSFNLPAGFKDSDGDNLMIGLPYRIYILSVCDGVNADESMLSTSNRAFAMLNVDSRPVSNLVVTDVGDNGNASDMQISFSRADDESKVSEYRVIVVRNAKSFIFSSSDAIQLPPERYASVPKSGEDKSVTLPESLRDSDGNFINNHIAYRVFVLSMPDGIHANIEAMSAPSDSIILKPGAGVDNQDGLSDFQIFTREKILNVQISPLPENSYLIVFSTEGQELFKATLTNGLNEFDLSRLSDGIYIARIHCSKGMISRKLVLH